MDKKNSSAPAVRFIEIDREQQGQRIDNFLFKTLKGLPRSRIYRLIRKGEIRVNKKRVKPEFKLSAGDLLRIPPLRQEDHSDGKPSLPSRLLDQVESKVLYENAAILIIDKPAGLAVHSGSGVRFGVIDVMRELRPKDPVELVHRLDRDTSGCLMLAKNREALLGMQALLRSDEMRKFYSAIVKGRWPRGNSRIEQPLKKMTMPNGEKRVFADPSGQTAKTLIRNVSHRRYESIQYSQLDIQLKTGRTHQIRVHCQFAGHEIGGDQKYGDRDFNRQLKGIGCKRLLLHAGRLELPRTAHTKALEIVAPFPPEFKMLNTDD